MDPPVEFSQLGISRINVSDPLLEQVNYVEALKEDIKTDLIRYTGNEYIINDKLRKKTILSQRDTKFVENLDSAFTYSPPIKRPIIVYRGLDYRYPFDNMLEYISTSLNETVASSATFAGKKCCLLVITVSIGTRLLPLYTISEVKYEKEILLPRNGRLFVTNTEYDTGGREVIHLTYIPPVSVEVNSSTTVTQIKETFSPEIWTKRLLSLVIEEELELFTPEEIINNIVADSFKNENIPEFSIQEAITTLRIKLNQG